MIAASSSKTEGCKASEDENSERIKLELASAATVELAYTGTEEASTEEDLVRPAASREIVESCRTEVGELSRLELAS